MNHRTMICFFATEDALMIRTISRDFRSPHRFVLLFSRLWEAREKGFSIAYDLHSFLKLRIEETVKGKEMLSLEFSWLSKTGNNKLTGHEERLLLSYEDLMQGIETSKAKNGKTIRLLTAERNSYTQITFCHTKNLHQVVQNKHLRRKLGKFLCQNFRGYGDREVQIFDDFVPYSFFFQEESSGRHGICGGIILHGQEDLRTAHYEIHT